MFHSLDQPFRTIFDKIQTVVVTDLVPRKIDECFEPLFFRLDEFTSL